MCVNYYVLHKPQRTFLDHGERSLGTMSGYQAQTTTMPLQNLRAGSHNSQEVRSRMEFTAVKGMLSMPICFVQEIAI